MLSLTITVLEAAFLLLLAVIFIVAARHKIMSRCEFGNIVSEYKVVPAELLPFIVWLIPLLELAIAALIFTPHAQIGLALAASLLTLYSALMLVTLWRGIRLADCGCGDPSRRNELNSWPVVRNVLLSVIAMLIYVQPFSWRALPITAWPIILAAGVFLVLLYYALEQLLNNQHNKKLLEARYA